MTGRTLVLGGPPRSDAAWCPLEQSRHVDGVFHEVLVRTSPGAIDDEWRFFRALHPHCQTGGVLTVVGAAPAVISALRLAGFESFRTDRAGGEMRVRSRVVSRPRTSLSCSVVVPCRNEVDNIEPLIHRLPDIGSATEIVFVDGASTDGTAERIQQMAGRFPERSIRLLHQGAGRGKGAAVFQGFDAAQGDVLIILDADMAVAPEHLPRFYLALAEGVGRFANGTRFAYSMAPGAMPRANRAGNRLFAGAMSLVIDHAVTDTLCGTKALFRADWRRLRAIRPLFGHADPWGDFELLLGAAYLGLRLVEVPVPYGARTAGESKMRAFRDAPVLLQTLGYGLARVRLGTGRAPAGGR